MKIVVRANTTQYDSLIAKGIPDGVTILQSPDAGAIAYFDLLFSEEGPAFPAITDQPVFVNAVIQTYAELPANYTRVNAWNSFLERDSMEIAGKDTADFNTAVAVLNTLKWKYSLVPDIPGMIAARVIATIVNEAYFALGEDLSTKEEIDIAMRSGTNYPYGPFEWASKIGLDNIFQLLKKMAAQSDRYDPAPALVNETAAKP